MKSYIHINYQDQALLVYELTTRGVYVVWPVERPKTYSWRIKDLAYIYDEQDRPWRIRTRCSLRDSLPDAKSKTQIPETICWAVLLDVFALEYNLNKIMEMDS